MPVQLKLQKVVDISYRAITTPVRDLSSIIKNLMPFRALEIVDKYFQLEGALTEVVPFSSRLTNIFLSLTRIVGIVLAVKTLLEHHQSKFEEYEKRFQEKKALFKSHEKDIETALKEFEAALKLVKEKSTKLEAFYQQLPTIYHSSSIDQVNGSSSTDESRFSLFLNALYIIAVAYEERNVTKFEGRIKDNPQNNPFIVPLFELFKENDHFEPSGSSKIYEFLLPETKHKLLVVLCDFLQKNSTQEQRFPPLQLLQESINQCYTEIQNMLKDPTKSSESLPVPLQITKSEEMRTKKELEEHLRKRVYRYLPGKDSFLQPVFIAGSVLALAVSVFRYYQKRAVSS